MKNIYNQIGDTIVEVLIAMAVLSLILGGAYSISNRSLGSIRQAQEHTEALKYAEGQIERLKALNSGHTNVFNNGSFCIKHDITLGDSIVNSTNPACTVGQSVLYAIQITRAESPFDSGHYLFTVSVKWDNFHGNGQDNVTLKYKLSKG